jgi:hypothetical protein
MQRDMKAALDGAIGGGVATGVMSLLMLAAAKAGFIDRQPPEEIADAVLDAAGAPGHSEETEDALAVALHFTFGIGMGALFGVLHRRLRLPIPAFLHGLLFGCLLWTVSYKGWVPGLGIMPPPEHDRPSRQLTTVLAHWVYGAILGAIMGWRQE